MNIFHGCICSMSEYFSWVNISQVNIFQGWIFFRGEYFSGMNIFQGCIFSRGEYFSEVNIFKGIIFFIFFRGEYFSGLDISQFKSRIRTDYFGLVIVSNLDKKGRTLEGLHQCRDQRVLQRQQSSLQWSRAHPCCTFGNWDSSTPITYIPNA